MNTDWNKIIEQYLNNELSQVERQKFESELKNNKELQQELELHQLTKNVIQRNTLRSQVKQTGSNFHLKKKIINGGIVLLIVGIIAASAYFIVTNSSTTEKVNSESPEQAMFEKMEQYLSFDNLESQYFDFTGEPDVFLTESGVLLSLTKESLLLDGKPYTGKATIQWQEAVHPSDFVSAGLSSMADDRLLETQGMFSINAFTPDGEKLELSDEGVYVQVPVDSVKQGMKLFTGVPKDNGDVNWTKPIELNRLPTQKDMADIDLYPPEFEPKLNALKWDTTKKKRDSLYLSFEPHDEYSYIINYGVITPINDTGYIYLNGPDQTGPYYDSLYTSKPTKDSSVSFSKDDFHVIFPSKVLAIWNPKFNNTIIATQEFEDRMPFIHQTCDGNVLDLYANNLNQPLWELDEKAVKLGYKTFQKFVNQRVGKIAIDDAHQENINTFYRNAVKEIHEMRIERIEEALKKEQQWDNETHKLRYEQSARNGMSKWRNKNLEFGINLKNVYKQLGVTAGFYMNSSTSVTYNNTNVNICNIDRYVSQTTTKRTSGTFKYEKNGKTAKLTYHPVTVQVKGFKEFDKLYMYCFPKELDSYVRQDFSKGALEYSLNADFHYSAVIVGLNENGYFYYPLDKLKPGNLGSITLEEISKQEFEERINALNNNSGKNTAAINNELTWLFREKEEYKVQQKRRNNKLFRDKISPTIYICGEPAEERSINKNSNSPDFGIN